MPGSNPFFHRGPIHNRVYFFGREQETGQALSLLGNGQSISLVGQRRIGKSSFLFHLADPHIFTQYGLDPAQHLFVYLDCGSLSTLPPPDLYRVLLEEIGDTLTDVVGTSLLNREADPAETRHLTHRAFEQTLRHLTRQGWQLILLLDEFERLSRNPHLDPDFFSGLRALAARNSVAYVTASKQPLLELTYANASALSSPFFNIFASIRLGLFAEEEAHNLLTTLAARSGLTFSPSTLDLLLDLAGPHPLFLQIAGFHAFELMQTSEVRSTKTSEVLPDPAELRRRFLDSVEEHFTYYWRNLSPEEQRALATLPAIESGPTLTSLEKACLIIRRNDRYDYLSPAFRAFVQAQAIPGLLQAGPVAIDREQHQASLHGQPLVLTTTQYTLLIHLVERAGQVVSNESLEQALWGETYVEDPERLKSVIKGLRQALGAEAARLENVRGVGYRFLP
ncbi:MAG: winged helix-turn-helix domain-containing protein [Anaerolineae bacterium]|nr:winged helix-turn-helix domain-containing protein [Anaerolineae bacterium]